MALSEEQQAAIERIQENASLTDNLTDQAARALLRWAEEQIEAGAAPQEVVAAMRAANKAEAEDAAGAIAAAAAALPGRAAPASPAGAKEAALDAAPPARQAEASGPPARDQDPEREAQSRAETAEALAAWRQRRSAQPPAPQPSAAPDTSAASAAVPPAPADGVAAQERGQSRLSFWSRLRRGFGSRRKRR